MKGEGRKVSDTTQPYDNVLQNRPQDSEDEDINNQDGEDQGDADEENKKEAGEDVSANDDEDTDRDGNDNDDHDDNDDHGDNDDNDTDRGDDDERDKDKGEEERGYTDDGSQAAQGNDNGDKFVTTSKVRATRLGLCTYNIPWVKNPSRLKKARAIISKFYRPQEFRTQLDFLFSWTGQINITEREFEGLCRIVGGYLPIDMGDQRDLEFTVGTPTI